MTELPKELIPELLGLVLDDKIMECWINGTDIEYSKIGCRSIDDCEEYMEAINIDTLTRLMKEWCFKQGYFSILMYRSGGNYECKMFLDETNTFDYGAFAFSEFEAVLKATHWVMKEKEII